MSNRWIAAPCWAAALVFACPTAEDDARLEGWRIQIQIARDQYSVALRTFALQHERAPNSVEELAVNRVYRTDPWGNVYLLRSVAGRSHVCTPGADGEPGGTGEAQDFCITDESSYPNWLMSE